ncbi:hypothetical protein [Clostridium sp.]|jgi:hypothetical protein|uniref:hypothetical protein n=1 Tax=Clostridium sp. TaxID=1506 RepID=UPI003EEC2071
MTTNNVQIFLKDFGNFEITKYFDPESLSDLSAPQSSTKAEFFITNGDRLAVCKLPSVVEDTTFTLNASFLKEDNQRVYDAFIEQGTNLGRVSFSNGNVSRDYSQLWVSKGIDLKGNKAKFSDVSVKFQK